MDDQAPIVIRARALLREAADSARAADMAAYMKTEMPFYGVTSPTRRPISRTLRTEFPATTRGEYTGNVRALWRGEHREEKYLAVAYARAFPHYITLSSVPIYRTMIVQGAWWDFVDEIAAHLVGTVLLRQREQLTPRMEAWTMSSDTWLRRTSILCQLRHGADTDVTLLGTACSRNLADDEFFVRKAIGWALREYAKTNSDWVHWYVEQHGDQMSGLSRREALKHIQ